MPTTRHPVEARLYLARMRAEDITSGAVEVSEVAEERKP
jgi:hypothetical protein